MSRQPSRYDEFKRSKLAAKNSALAMAAEANDQELSERSNSVHSTSVRSRRSSHLLCETKEKALADLEQPSVAMSSSSVMRSQRVVSDHASSITKLKSAPALSDQVPLDHDQEVLLPTSTSAAAAAVASSSSSSSPSVMRSQNVVNVDSSSISKLKPGPTLSLSDPVPLDQDLKVVPASNAAAAPSSSSVMHSPKGMKNVQSSSSISKLTAEGPTLSDQVQDYDEVSPHDKKIDNKAKLEESDYSDFAPPIPLRRGRVQSTPGAFAVFTTGSTSRLESETSASRGNREDGTKPEWSVDDDNEAGGGCDDVTAGLDDDVSGLAVAVAVSQDDDDMNGLPSADGVEYDPDAKPTIYNSRRRLWLFIALGVVVAVLAIVGVAVGMRTTNKKKNSAPAPPREIPYRETLGIHDYVVATLGEKEGWLLQDPTTPYARALQWITHLDPFQLTPNEPSFLQRYIASYLYFATSVEQPWTSCNPLSVEDAASDNNRSSTSTTACTFSQLIQTDPEVFNDVPWIRWLSNTTECAWAGVACDDAGQIQKIALDGSNMTGSFPEGIKYLPFLQSLSLAFGHLRGTLPTDLVSLKHLINLEVHMNDFTGTVPLEWWQARNLKMINVRQNQLTGIIAPEIANCQDCKLLMMSENSLNGTIPTEIAYLQSISFFHIHQNRLTGTIPTELGSMAAVYSLRVHHNILTGTIPTQIGLMSRIGEIQLQYNFLNGTLPDEIWQPQLGELDASNCYFTGTISSQVESSSELNILRLNNNELSGSIPSELGTISNLGFLWLQGNHLTGTMPDAICALRGPQLLKQIYADCLSNNATGMAAEITCPMGCCTDCCVADDDSQCGPVAV